VLAFYSILYLHFPFFLEILSHQSKGRRTPAACDKKEYGLTGEKEMQLSICGSYDDASDRAVFSAAVK